MPGPDERLYLRARELRIELCDDDLVEAVAGHA
jgi:hypothetical protein